MKSGSPYKYAMKKRALLSDDAAHEHILDFISELEKIQFGLFSLSLEMKDGDSVTTDPKLWVSDAGDKIDDVLVYLRNAIACIRILANREAGARVVGKKTRCAVNDSMMIVRDACDGVDEIIPTLELIADRMDGIAASCDEYNDPSWVSYDAIGSVVKHKAHDIRKIVESLRSAVDRAR